MRARGLWTEGKGRQRGHREEPSAGKWAWTLLGPLERLDSGVWVPTESGECGGGGRGSNGNRGEGGKGRAQGLGTQVSGLCPRGLQFEGQPTTLLVASGIKRWPRRENCPHASASSTLNLGKNSMNFIGLL